ncbi:heavy metal-binding protein HIP-like [Mercenaria mercenaria]|uniref:heavy metal-binding protein HIP-like n=1 Tax=Mercenaria mercenaria TaxID=6596 RepID=UPI00234F7377|nr:heavy metal-binding protein HIP-like [Mercenaria mercenaria]
MCRIKWFLVILVFVCIETVRCYSQEETISLLLNKTAALEIEVKNNKDVSESENAKLKNEILTLKLKQTKLENENKELHFTLGELTGDRTGHDDKSKRLLMSISQSFKNAAFSASLTNHVTNLGNSQTIVFDNVFTNNGNVYSSMTGVFTAPHNGTYYFSATVMSHYGQYLESEICLNGNSLVFMYSYDSVYVQGTNSIVLVLKEGDMVWVRHHGNEGSNVYGEHWSSFSGFQIS